MSDSKLNDLSRAGLDLAKVVGVAGAIAAGAWFASATVARIGVLEGARTTLEARVDSQAATINVLVSDVRTTKAQNEQILRNLEGLGQSVQNLDRKLDERTIYAVGRR